jgi:glyoxylase-like metal-dependent hydrolase (beta-lactamase superfamily II)
VTEIFDNVFCLRDGDVFVYLVRSGDESLAVDAGFASTARLLADELPAVGVRRIGRIVLTHGHGDHYEGCTELVGRFASEVCIHADDARLIAETGDAVLFRELDRAYPGLFPAPRDSRPAAPAATMLHEGDSVAIGDRRLDVLHTPGHSPGSICLLDRAHGLLFSGDAVSGDFVHFYCAPDVLDASQARLERTGFEHLLMAHPYPPEKTNVLSGNRARAFLARSREARASARERVRQRMRQDPRISPQELTKQLAGPTLISVIRMMEAAAR